MLKCLHCGSQFDKPGAIDLVLAFWKAFFCSRNCRDRFRIMKPYSQIITLILLSIGMYACTPATQFDPNAYAVGQRLTSEVADQNAQYYGMMATGTAQAPILAITQRAADLSFSQTQNSMQLTDIALSFTPTNTPVPTITPSPTPNMTGTIEVAKVIATTTAIAQKTERDEITNTIRAILSYAIILIAAIVAVTYAYVHLKRLSYVPHKTDVLGRILPMTEVVEGVAYDVERATNGMMIIRKNFVEALPAITAERQDRVTASSQTIDLATRARISKRLLEGQQEGQNLLPASVDAATRFLLPAWDIINGWDGKNGLPYYTARGLEFIDSERFPHIAVLGTSGSGKTRRFIRPVIACALAAGHKVIIIGESTDYWVFEGHTNATLLRVNKITEPDQAARYANILKAIVAEMNRRDDVLTSLHRSTWVQAGRNHTFVVLDELGNALNVIEEIDRKSANQMRAWVESLTAKGRKTGLNIILANQRATGMASILANTGKAIFRVEVEEERHKALRGASELQEGYFFARFGRQELAGAFEPTDEQIQQFLRERPVGKLRDDDQWIDAIAMDVPDSLPGTAQAALKHPERKADSMSDWIGTLDEKRLKIVELYQAGGMENVDIEYAVYGYSNGRTARTVTETVEQYRKLGENTTTTPTTTGNLPDLGAVLA